MSSTILAFDTSADACSVAIQKGQQTLCLHKIAPMQQAQLILPMIQQALNHFSLELDEVDAIGFGRGPGSFTGIRIASSVAQGLAFAAQKPVISISSLQILAQAAFLEHQCTRIMVAVDARMDQVYFATYEEGQAGVMELMGEEKLCYPAEIQIEKYGEWNGVGNGFDKFPARPLKIYQATDYIARALLSLAMKKHEDSQHITASAALPSYIRTDE